MEDHQNLKKALDQIQPPSFSKDFESKLMKDWSRNTRPETGLRLQLTDVLVFGRNHKKAAFFIASVLMVVAILSHQYFNDRGEELNRVDVLSELSLSTL